MQKRLKVLFLPAWYPSEANPIAGIFIREHVQAASIYNEVVVLYAYMDPTQRSKKLSRITDNTEDNIRIIRIRYRGFLSNLKKFAAKLKVSERESNFFKTYNKIISILLGVIKVPFVLLTGFLYYLSIFIAFRSLIKSGWKPDIIHAHVFTVGVPAVILGRLYKVPVIITEHWTGFIRHNLTLFNRFKTRFAMNKAQIILPVSGGLKQAIQAYGVQNRFVIIPNAVNTDIFYPISLQSTIVPKRVKRLLQVAILSPAKGIPYLLESLNRIKQERQDFHLDIVGDGPNRAEYEEQAKKLELQNIVQFHGRKTKEEVSEYMRRCDFFVQPSLFETFGVVYIEAMACGKPVIGTNIPGPKEIINEDVGVLIPPEDVEALKRVILYMLDNYQNYSSQKITQYAKERFSHQTVGKMLDNVYKELL